MKARRWIPLMLILSACGREAHHEVLEQAEIAQGDMVRAVGSRGQHVAAFQTYAAAPPVESVSDPVPRNPMLIRDARVVVRSDTVRALAERARRIAGIVGGHVGSAEMAGGDAALASIVLVVRVPADAFDRALEGFERLGTVERSSVTSTDVTEEFVDVEARRANARRLETRLVAMLASRTGRLADVLAVERELSRVRETIERFEGRARYLREHTAWSTITVELLTPATVGRPTPGLMREAAEESWENFLWLVALVIRSLGVTVPLGAAGLTAWVLLRRRLTRDPVITSVVPRPAG